MTQSFKIDHASTDNLASAMDDISHRIVDLMGRYNDTIQGMNANRTLVGDAGTQNVSTGQDVTDAQHKVQARFKNINDVLRQTGTASAHTDSDAQSALQSVAGSISFQS